MEIAIILLLCIALPVIIMVIGIKKSRRERIEERDEMFYEGDVKFGENADGTPISIDAVDEISKILQDEVEKTKKPRKKKSARKKKSEFPIEPVASKPKSKKERKPKNKDKKSEDQMLLS